ncbi:Mannose-1-phosphate guanylyltransferase [Acidisarcina polymorpha]|uniref:Mannose-1-phosphate guanylyltransferase n=1 Tax=Acidisarcina polymorpha TaxID=2211140 RepID=A0A2Z5FTV7_9BACT|nr:NDP-sugar synthase [Acidisarcina polymorpha]AXC10132.1 Mannose-1-phosphate guanylyltransferase [Acidisarcina polymorpha]
MIAIIVAADHSAETTHLDDHIPLPLFLLGDRPILHHVVDYLKSLGIRRCEFVLGHLPEKIEAYLGDGTRWGLTFGFHLLPSTSKTMSLVELIASGLDDEIILARGDTLPQIQLPSPAAPTIFLTEGGAWTGWAVLPKSSRLFAALVSQTEDKSKRPGATFKEVVVSRELDFRTGTRLLESQHDLLTGAFRASGIDSPQTKPGIWIARNASVHPSAILEPPVYVGSNCKIGMGAHIGPSAVLGDACIVDERSSVSHTLVAPGTYIGQGLELDHLIINGNRLVNTKLDTTLLISDSFLISGLKQKKKKLWLHHLLSKAGAAACLILLFPLAVVTLLILLVSGRGKFVREHAIKIPAEDDRRLWKEYRYLSIRLCDPASDWWTQFVAEVWLGLLSVVKGDLFLVGLKPRSRREVERLPSDWRSLYLDSKAGLITEASVMFGKTPTEDELHSADAYYAAVGSVRHDLKLLRLYLRRLLAFGVSELEVDDVNSLTHESALENVVER